jgi:glyoxylase-like metal-dependent hydrolase (beta-lactamase superfamily II)
VRVVGLHPGVLVATSRVFQTACTVVRDGDECFVIDSPVLPDELDVLPALLAQAGFPFSGLLATHGDWDHLLGRLAFRDAALGVAETTAARLTAAPGEAARKLRAFDDELYLERAAPLSLGQVQALPVPGTLDVGAQSVELHPTEGHVPDGMALWLGWAGVLVAGDFLSPVEIPMLSEGGSRSAYLATLERLRPLVEQADHVVAGHGGAIDGRRALSILDEDVAYLEGLPDSKLPIARRSAEQRRIHAENLERL